MTKYYHQTQPISEPWSYEEHQRFLDALEKFGNGDTGREWTMIADYVSTRSLDDIKCHAHLYYLQLQQRSSFKKNQQKQKIYQTYQPRNSLDHYEHETHNNINQTDNQQQLRWIYSIKSDNTSSTHERNKEIYQRSVHPNYESPLSHSNNTKNNQKITNDKTSHDPSNNNFNNVQNVQNVQNVRNVRNVRNVQNMDTKTCPENTCNNKNNDVSSWTLEEDSIFENILAEIEFIDTSKNKINQNHTNYNNSEITFKKIASLLPDKTVDDVKKHYKTLEDDLQRIEENRNVSMAYFAGNNESNQYLANDMAKLGQNNSAMFLNQNSQQESRILQL